MVGTVRFELTTLATHIQKNRLKDYIKQWFNGKMQGSEMVGKRSNLHRLHDLFHKEVGINHDLKRNASSRLSEGDCADLANRVIAELEGDPKKGWSVFRDWIKKDPQPLAQLLSIEIPKKQVEKHFVDIARSKGRGSFVR